MSASVARVSTIRKALAALDAGLADLEVRRDRLIVTEMAAVLESLAGIKPGSVVVGVEEVQCPGPDLPAFGGGVAELAHVAADLAQQVRELLEVVLGGGVDSVHESSPSVADPEAPTSGDPAVTVGEPTDSPGPGASPPRPGLSELGTVHASDLEGGRLCGAGGGLRSSWEAAVTCSGCLRALREAEVRTP